MAVMLRTIQIPRALLPLRLLPYSDPTRSLHGDASQAPGRAASMSGHCSRVQGRKVAISTRKRYSRNNQYQPPNLLQMDSDINSALTPIRRNMAQGPLQASKLMHTGL